MVGFKKVGFVLVIAHDDGKDVSFDIDPEVVRKGVRNLMQQVAQIERERVNTSRSIFYG